MIKHGTNISRIAALLFGLSACAYMPQSSYPPQPAQQGYNAMPASSMSMPQSSLYTSEFSPPYVSPAWNGAAFDMMPPTPGVSSGTEVGMKIDQMRNELRNLQINVQNNSDQFNMLRQETESLSQSYHGLVAAISARLQVGTTPGNPILVQQWNEAQAQLDRVNENVSRLNNIATMVAANSTVANFMLETVKSSYSISGAVDEDHRQLRIMEDDINRSIVMVERLLKDLSEGVARQAAYVGSERSNLTTLSLAIKNGELYGMSLANRPFLSAPASTARPFDFAAQGVDSVALSDTASAPLVVIRFDKPNVSYERELYSALNKALQRKPNASFNLVAVSPGRGNPAAQALSSSSARKSAEAVLRSLVDMGIPTTRVGLSMRSSLTADVNEVHLYVR